MDEHDVLGSEIVGDKGSSISPTSVSSVFILLRFQDPCQAFQSISDMNSWLVRPRTSPLGSSTKLRTSDGGTIVPTVKESSASNRS